MNKVNGVNATVRVRCVNANTANTTVITIHRLPSHHSLHLSRRAREYFDKTPRGGCPFDVEFKDASRTIPAKTAADRLNDRDRVEAFEELVEFVAGRDIDISSHLRTTFLIFDRNSRALGTGKICRSGHKTFSWS